MGCFWILACAICLGDGPTGTSAFPGLYMLSDSQSFCLRWSLRRRNRNLAKGNPQRPRRIFPGSFHIGRQPIHSLRISIPMIRRFVSFALLALVLAGCATRPAFSPTVDMSPAASVSPAESLAIAETFLTHRWRAEARNILHGNDPKGIRVDTPDIGFRPVGRIRPGWWRAGEWNTGMPYQWGGFDTPAEFDAKVAAGFAAGDVYTTAKRAGLDNAVSTSASGIDCSGFISRCWRLPRSYSTRELPGLCIPLENEMLLQPGDILNKTNEHVLLFAGWANPEKTHYLAYETGCPPTWKVLRNTIPVAYTAGLGYRPFRFRCMRNEGSPEP